MDKTYKQETNTRIRYLLKENSTLKERIATLEYKLGQAMKFIYMSQMQEGLSTGEIYIEGEEKDA